MAFVITCYKRDRITPVLNQLHWLPVRQLVIYKTAMLTYKSLNIGQPEHLSVLLSDCTPSPGVSEECGVSGKCRVSENGVI